MRPDLLQTILFCGLLSLPPSALAVSLDGFAAMGASETQGTDHKGSWVPWLAVDRGLNFGPSQSYNKAVGGSTSATLLSGGQHTKVASLVDAGSVDLSFLFIGGLDVPPVTSKILAGTLNINTWSDGIVNNITTAIDTVLNEGATGLVVSSLPDMRLVPGAIKLAPPEATVAIRNAIDVVNAKLKSAVLDRELVYINIADAMVDLYESPFVVGGVTINMTTGSNNPTHFYQDDIHPAHVGNGFFANMMMTALNDGYDQNLTLFTDQAILAKAGLSGSYTGETSAVDYGNYIKVSVPGDANRDDVADGGDYTIWADNYFTTGATWSIGDFNKDGIVDGGDYTIWADNYSVPPATASAVPEPSTAALSLIGLMTLIFFVRRRR